MEKYAKFEVPADALTDFISEVIDTGLTATTGKMNRNGDYVVTVGYEKGQEDEIDTLGEYLEELISDLDNEEEEEKNDEDR